MPASLIQSADEHHWILLDHRIARVTVERDAVRLESWSLDGSLELRFAAPFVLRLPSGAERRLDPAQPEALGPLLPLVRRALRALTVRRDGELTVEIDDGSSIVAAPLGAREAWEVQGGGALEGMDYFGGVGRDTPLP